MKILVSWLRDFVDLDETPEAIGERLSLRGLALEGIEGAPPDVLPPARVGDDRPDAVLDFDVTANRPDCLSVVGVAREAATAFRAPLRLPGTPGTGDWLAAPPLAGAPEDGAELAVRIEAPDLCARYAGVVADVAVGSSPPWLQGRLLAAGVRPINNVVDVTNYVLLELGQPLHAFDHARLAGTPTIVVRRADPGETLVTLDGRLRALEPDTLVIADAERPVAIAGVMGGAATEVSAATRRIVLESAWFQPASVRRTSRRLGLRTEASQRFERGADLSVQAFALARACGLLAHLAAGRAAGGLVDCEPRPYVAPVLEISAAAVARLLGMAVPPPDIVRILEALGFAVEPMRAGAWRVRVPGWRGDVRRPVDLIEEIGRHHGFEHLPSTFPAVDRPPPASDPRIDRDARVRRALTAMGFTEAITFAFIERAAAEPFLDGAAPVALANPLSEKFAVMRPSLLPGLVEAAGHNRRRDRRDVRLFEIGTVFSPLGERRAAAFVWTGHAVLEHWSGGARTVDFFDARGVVEQLAALLDLTPAFAPIASDALAPGRAAAVHVDGMPVGRVGLLRDELAQRQDWPEGEPVYVGELDLDRLAALAPRGVRHVAPLPRHPAVVRDISILVDETLSAETVRGTIRAAGPGTLVEVREFDRYQGRGIPEGKVSLSLRLTFQAPDRTLTDLEVHEAMTRIVERLREALGAMQR